MSGEGVLYPPPLVTYALYLYCEILSQYHSAMGFYSRCVQYGTSFTRLDELNRMALTIFKI